MTDKPLISFDYAIKYLLKDKGDYEIVEGFISALLKSQGYKDVKIIALLDTESNKEDSKNKRSLADLIVEDEEHQKYIVEIVHKTRNHPTILYGASPRASVALLVCSKALAAIRGRDFPTPDDVRDVTMPVLRHRLALRAEAELDGATTDAVISDIIKTVEIPR